MQMLSRPSILATWHPAYVNVVATDTFVLKLLAQPRPGMIEGAIFWKETP